MCFTDLIGLRYGCDEITPTSGLYLDTIGFTKEFLDRVASSPFTNGEELAASKIDFAIRQVVNDIQSTQKLKFHTKSIVDGSRVGFFQKNLITKSGENGFLKGIEIELCNEIDYVDFYLSRIDLQITSNTSVDVLVYDLYENNLLDTITIQGSANEVVSVYPKKLYKSENRNLNLFIGYLSTGIDSNNTTVGNGGCTNCGRKTRLNKSIMARSVKIDNAEDKTNTNLQGSSDTGGLSLIYSINCNYNDWLCEKSNLLALPILYKTGLNLVDYALDDSEQNNTKTIIDRDKLRAKAEKLEQEYENRINNIIENMDLPTGECFVCRAPVRNRIILP